MGAQTRQGKPVSIVVYRWAGEWGPFKVKIPCGECALTRDVIADTLQHELAGIAVELEVRDWLSQWWKPLARGGWHAPIVMVDGKLLSQGRALNRGLLTQAVIDAASATTAVIGNHVFGKATCPHCKRARQYLDDAGIAYSYHDVVREPRALYEMLARVKPIIGAKTPVTVPQVWLDGTYIGGADQLSARLQRSVEPNPERGRNALSPAAG
ncbi:MAG: glutaredoxin [Rhodocyclaceae bacterium]|nr:glutaredoxin [Rhodocyclaceae bacterium]MCP5231453.1 glutaredoxin [Zoogloeaceae bacterium]MCP5239289.1 glutaredoxin [Zoogloeaceae bacterium]MCP5255876.1 glutaredoxin [Zoogloeaceae bacterium]MCW5616053.1 glutaredoxin [Rhodocyclaceae bacterium]